MQDRMQPVRVADARPAIYGGDTSRSYYIWNIGCQMNSADARRAGTELEKLGYHPVARPEAADLVLVNSCVVRQSAEDKVVGRLMSLRSLKKARPGVGLVLMGCLVGNVEELHARFPHVDLFLRPSNVQGLIEWVRGQLSPKEREGKQVSPLSLTVGEGQGVRVPVSAEVPAMMGCDRHCTYCLVRIRRGAAQSRPLADVVTEAEGLVQSGVREIVLLGQNIDAYGRDLAEPVSLAQLLRRVHDIPGLLRLRFLTSHPADLEDEVIETVAELPRACPHWELPVQAGDDEVLRRMVRGYTASEYVSLVGRIRARLPGCSLATDIIVGFPGETSEQFERTLELMRQVRFDAVHVAAYSVRPGTPAARLPDDVTPEEKERRRRAVEDLQEAILTEMHAALLGQEVEVLVEEAHKGRWKGRTPTNKLVFFDHPADWRSRLATVRITKTGPWSLQGEICSPS